MRGSFMFLNIDKWGNSLGIRLPAQLARELGLHQGSTIDLVIEDGRLAIYPVKNDLQAMVDQISDGNRQELLFDGPPVGKEIW